MIAHTVFVMLLYVVNITILLNSEPFALELPDLQIYTCCCLKIFLEVFAVNVLLLAFVVLKFNLGGMRDGRHHFINEAFRQGRIKWARGPGENHDRQAP